LALNQGSIVSLDRGVQEPLDLMVNGTLIARGEVVESDGQFGLRLIDVVSPGERLKKLK
jgi:flagellar motor switch protein FliN/FliY